MVGTEKHTGTVRVPEAAVQKLILSVLVMVGVGAGQVSAEDAPTRGRTLSQYGVALSWGEDTGVLNPGWGVSTLTFTYFDVNSPDGAYFGFLSGGYLVHSAGGVTIGDTKVLVLGWRQSAGQTGISLDASLAPVVGARYDGRLLLGSTYTGLGGVLGVYFPVAPDFDVGVSWEPVVHVASWGSPPASNLTYGDLVVYLVAKSNTETRKLAWR